MTASGAVALADYDMIMRGIGAGHVILAILYFKHATARAEKSATGRLVAALFTLQHVGAVATILVAISAGGAKDWGATSLALHGTWGFGMLLTEGLQNILAGLIGSI
ncbi:hypothetical protein CHLRE_06g263841v5 [Chlamydomonas reinhardtii]|uniref:Uncharacterized protein n=1 Tax=Chlamydomonas reinhardtii TaxID=3055 RepID=A0A2K3DMV6_CHLRE|nr:uncharacterized protein CHLRE_06g263841v5 [Chlamydomonas reinhardtii]PNW81869.1 hypothetical protein CHLRE_06g263841v5 [Chlamydomonas reinhardtii]